MCNKLMQEGKLASSKASRKKIAPKTLSSKNVRKILFGEFAKSVTVKTAPPLSYTQEPLINTDIFYKNKP